MEHPSLMRTQIPEGDGHCFGSVLGSAPREGVHGRTYSSDRSERTCHCQVDVCDPYSTRFAVQLNKKVANSSGLGAQKDAISPVST